MPITVLSTMLSRDLKRRTMPRRTSSLQVIFRRGSPKIRMKRPLLRQRHRLKQKNYIQEESR